MKFAIAALLATTSAIRIGSEGKKGCVSWKLAKKGFEALDTDDSGSLSPDEIKVGIEELAKSQDRTITDKEWKWLEETGEKIDSKTPGSVDEEEFLIFANAVFKHFDLCHLLREGKEQKKPKQCVTKELAEATFEHLDTDKSGDLSYGEI